MPHMFSAHILRSSPSHDPLKSVRHPVNTPSAVERFPRSRRSTKTVVDRPTELSPRRPVRPVRWGTRSPRGGSMSPSRPSPAVVGPARYLNPSRANARTGVQGW